MGLITLQGLCKPQKSKPVVYIFDIFDVFLTLVYDFDFQSSASYGLDPFRSLAVLDSRVGHTMDTLSPFISVFFHSD